jgi:GrpB-like predicted nucleotidyltransferase (UPF0157 family)
METDESFKDKLRRVLSEPIALAEYDPAWPSTFEAEAARFAAFFPEGYIRGVEHVGSTAVPGLAAKPVVDILAFMDDFSLVQRTVPALEAAGYDYFFRPAFGDESPQYPWLIARHSSGHRVEHIHIALVGDDSQSERVLFRDRLRSHSEVARSYAALKRELAARFGDDREAYTSAKTAFITRETALASAELRA